MTVIPLRAGRQQQIPILAAGPLGGRGRVGRQPTEGGAVNFPQEDFAGSWMFALTDSALRGQLRRPILPLSLA